MINYDDINDNELFCVSVKIALAASNLKQYHLADKLDMQRTQLCGILTGKRRASMNRKIQISEALGYELGHFLKLPNFVRSKRLFK
jgi:transcriptional regulator with XRE-family HTH domain